MRSFSPRQTPPHLGSAGPVRSAGPAPPALKSSVATESLLHLQRSIGNRAVRQLLRQAASPAAGGHRSTARPLGLVQRDKPPSTAEQAAHARVVVAMERLKAKYRLGNVAEEHGAAWSEAELAQVDGAFAKLSREEQAELQGLTLYRTDKLDSIVRHGKTIPISGLTTNGAMIELTQGAFRDGLTVLHETGHVIHRRLVREAEVAVQNSMTALQLEVARQAVDAATRKAPRYAVDEKVATFSRSLAQTASAGSALLYSDESDREARQDFLGMAESQADIDRLPLEKLADPGAKAWLDVHDRQRDWLRAVETYLAEKKTTVGSQEHLTAFVDLVTKNHLAKKGFAPFNAYVEANWPEHPEEFFAQSYATWRSNPNYLKYHARPLFEWFEKGGHLPPKAKKLTAREVAPVLTELASEAEATFVTPIVEAGKEVVGPGAR